MKSRLIAGLKRVALSFFFLFPISIALASKPEMGKPAPPFSLVGLDSKNSVSLSDLKGKVVLVDFWASWCLPCKILMPKLSELKARLPDLEIITISVDEDRTKALTFLRSLEPDLKAVHDGDQKVADAYSLEGMPSCFLIDKQGHLRYRYDGYTVKDLEKVERQAKLLLSESLDSHIKTK